MIKLAPICSFLLATLPASLWAQVAIPRSLEYHTAATGDNVLAGWANPAGLAVKPEASIMAGFRADNPDSGGSKLGQYTLGFNSRGFSLVYQKDLFGNDVSGSTWRFSAANRFATGSIGVSYTLFKGTDPSASSWDVGLRYLALRGFDLGVVLRNLGRPAVRGDTLDPAVAGAISFIPLDGWVFSSEIQVSDPEGSGGPVYGYRALASISLTRGSQLTGALTFDDDFSLARIALGLTLGGADRAYGFVSVARNPGTTRLDAVSVDGVSSRDFSRDR